MAPAATLATVGERWAARWRASTTPVTPAHSALRSRAPRLRGSVHARHDQEEGLDRAGHAQVVEGDRLDRPGQGEDALGGVRAGLGLERGLRHRLHPDLASCRQGLDLVELGEGSSPSANHSRRTGRRPAASSSSTARRPSTWSPPSSPAPGAGARRRGPPVRGRRPRPTVGGRGGPARGGRPAAAAAGRAAPPAGRGLAAAPARGRGATSRATARQATPSPRPIGPSPSARVALTDTGPPTAPVRRSAISSVWGASRGVSATTVQSALATSRPARPTMPATSASRAMLSAPAQAGSVSGKWRPRSPSPAAPSRASARAWARASASLWPASPRPWGTSTPPSTSGRPGSSEKAWTSKPWPMRTLSPRAGARRRRGRPAW